MKEPVIDLKLCESCPSGYPWECWMCEKNVWCSRDKSEPEDGANGNHKIYTE